MKKQLFSACLALSLGIGAGYATSVLAQAKPEVLVKQRQSAMTLISKYFGPLGLMAAGKAPYDSAVAARNSGYLQALTQMPWDGFTADTKGEKSRGLPAIYENPAKFKEAQDHLTGAVAKMAAAAKDEAAFKSAAGEVSKACSNCHGDFRAK